MPLRLCLSPKAVVRGLSDRSWPASRGLHAAVPQAPRSARMLLSLPRRVPTAEVAEQAGRGSMRLCYGHRHRPGGARAREQGGWSPDAKAEDGDEDELTRLVNLLIRPSTFGD